MSLMASTDTDDAFSPPFVVGSDTTEQNPATKINSASRHKLAFANNLTTLINDRTKINTLTQRHRTVDPNACDDTTN